MSTDFYSSRWAIHVALALFAALLSLTVFAVPAQAKIKNIGNDCYLFAVTPSRASHPGAGVKASGALRCDSRADALHLRVSLERDGRRIATKLIQKADTDSVYASLFVRGTFPGDYRTKVVCSMTDYDTDYPFYEIFDQTSSGTLTI